MLHTLAMTEEIDTLSVGNGLRAVPRLPATPPSYPVGTPVPGCPRDVEVAVPYNSYRYPS